MFHPEMSSIRRLQSFSLVKNPKLGPNKSVSDFRWMYDASDLSNMQGSNSKLAEMGGVQGLAGALRTNLKTGIYKDEVDKGSFEERKKLFGVNAFPKPPLHPFLWHCFQVWNDPILMLLTASGFFSLIVGTVEAPSHGFIEGLAIICAVLIVVLVGGANNLSQEKAFRALDDSKEEEFFKVWRSGRLVRVPQSQVVVGDVVDLSAGDAIPADGVYVFGDDPATNEAKMTGESRDIEKNAASPFLLGGTELKRGALMFLVTSVGVNSSYGRIMSALASEQEDTPLQKKLEGLAELISKIGFGVSIIMFVFLIIVFIIESARDSDFSLSSLINIFILCITLLVVAVPEGLPLAVTLSLAYSMRKMVEDKNLVRVLSACETMGNATCVCSDKTGTLTQNKMTVIKGWVAGSGYDKITQIANLGTELRQLLVEGIVVNSKATEEAVNTGPTGPEVEVVMDRSLSGNDVKKSARTVVPKTEEKQETHAQKNIFTVEKPKTVWKGNQTEIALLEWLVKFQISVPEERARHTVQKNYPFDSIKKNSSVILKRTDGGFRRYWKGAGEQVFERASHYVDSNGATHSLGARKQEVSDFIIAMTKTGLRTLAFGYEDHDHLDVDPKDPNRFLDPPESDRFVFIGVVGIKDPLRTESRASVRTCQRAGIVVRMVTGDHPETAKFIATECGILTSPDHITMTGEEFRKLIAGSKAEAERVIPKLRVLARSKPEDKQELVKWLKAHGHVVAATGDGTNDAPALKEADVGIAMFIAGTAVAKQAAAILILDDNFASIVKSVMWGRSVFDNIRKFVQFQLTINFVALSVSLIGAFSFYTQPLTAVQLLWVNLIMDTLAALALGTEYPTVKLLDRKPYDRETHLISKLMWRNMICHSVFQLSILLMIVYAGADIWDLEEKSDHHYTMVFNTFVWFQIFNEINMRQVTPRDKHVFQGLLDNKIFLGVMVITVFFQYLMVEWFGSFARTTGLSVNEWFSCIGLGALVLPWGVIVRFIDLHDDDDGMITIPAGTFDGANLEVFEEDEIGYRKEADSHHHGGAASLVRRLSKKGRSEFAVAPQDEATENA